MKGLQVTAGMADGVHWNDDTDFAYHIGAAYSVYTKNANRWVIGGEYLHKKYDYKDMRIPVEQFTAEALFGSDIGKFHTQISVGLKFIIN